MEFDLNKELEWLRQAAVEALDSAKQTSNVGSERAYYHGLNRGIWLAIARIQAAQKVAIEHKNVIEFPGERYEG